MPFIVKKTVALIINSGNDYLIQVKANQKHLFQQIKSNISQAVPIDTYSETQKSRGRQEARHVELYNCLEGISKDWLNLEALVYVRRSGYRKESGYYCKEHFYITSVSTKSAKLVAQGIRGHWLIENRLHYVKDVHFKEDTCGFHVGQAVENQTILQNIAINIYRSLGLTSMKKATIRFANKVKELHELLCSKHIANS
jgi:predicted transposase YbfD/YdcC